jgi:hypothetical protein
VNRPALPGERGRESPLSIDETAAPRPVPHLRLVP